MSVLEQVQEKMSILPPEKQNEALDFIEFLVEKTRSAQVNSANIQKKKELKKAFATLAKLEAFSSIPDPIAWQRQIRQDRPLPGRSY